MNKQSKQQKKQEYIRANIWKRFFKYKLYELGILPLAGLALWKIPLWLGWTFLKIFNIDPSTSEWFCRDINDSPIAVTCSGTNLWFIWSAGLLIFLIFVAFVIINYKVAQTNVEIEAEEKFG